MASTYLLEKLPNLKQLKLFFKPQFGPERYDIIVEKKFIVFTRKNKKEDMIKICFDCEVNKDAINCSVKDETYFLTLPIIQDNFNDESDDFPTANELNIDKYSLIKCRFCENIVYNHSSNSSSNKLNKIYPLPSEYWLELSDMWFCCQSHQIDFNAKEIRAKQDALLIGKLFIILHSKNIIKNGIKLTKRTINDEYSVDNLLQNEKERKHKKLNPSHNGHQCNAHNHDNNHHHDNHHHHDNNEHDDNETSWDGVQAFNCYCNRCDTLIGIKYKTIINDDDDDEKDEILNEYHLYKFELCTEGSYKIPFARNSHEMDSVYHWYFVENYFSTKILDIKNARNVHKFLIYDYNYSLFIKINLMSTKCFIKCSSFDTSSENNKMAPILKLLFVNSSHLSFEENNEWIKKQNGHCITSSTENCQLLLRCIQSHNCLYPNIIRNQQFPFNMKMTFLRLLSRTWSKK